MRRPEIEPSSIGHAPEQVGFTSDRCFDQFRGTFRTLGSAGDPRRTASRRERPRHGARDAYLPAQGLAQALHRSALQFLAPRVERNDRPGHRSLDWHEEQERLLRVDGPGLDRVQLAVEDRAVVHP